ncbi:HTH-type transcriptional regulator CynR [Rhodobacteraceae bacterium THAF1]|uniref:LysR family transcriptional regulator n=1 Tax=Palleronia sp. THAF1 TaxID=2587842 RepID=UPI000F3B61B3|nr:LysR family transcriptional regulator [Palleronia sp. THAF1]QFU07961.1 HTH-type transcriptional regulator CynR [Palleronia sp. THAF1]VDC27812.1 HTH-type transcriptional regulator CynR [Rhodobacteraceae bacterium THAF1]
MFLTVIITDSDAMRNLDLTALRSFVTVAEVGGVTRAAGHLNLTQSAVSMQLKRLEESLGVALLDRSARTVALTPTGDQLLSYARRMLVLNDEAVARMTDDAFEGEIVLGVPHDILYPAIPPFLAAFAQRYPRLRVRLLSLPTRTLKDMFRRGECDAILTTEETLDDGAETLLTLPLVWAGAQNGTAHRTRPLSFAFCRNCIFSPIAKSRLDGAGIDWHSVVDSASDRAAEVAVMADLAVYVILDQTLPRGIAKVPDTCDLPALPDQNINLYRSSRLQSQVSDALATLLRDNYARLARVPMAAE